MLVDAVLGGGRPPASGGRASTSFAGPRRKSWWNWMIPVSSAAAASPARRLGPEDQQVRHEQQHREQDATSSTAPQRAPGAGARRARRPRSDGRREHAERERRRGLIEPSTAKHSRATSATAAATAHDGAGGVRDPASSARHGRGRSAARDERRPRAPTRPAAAPSTAEHAAARAGALRAP